jgi:hypothetical protein
LCHELTAGASIDAPSAITRLWRVDALRWNVGLGTKMYLIGMRTFFEARYDRTKRADSSLQFFPITLELMF